MNKIYRTFVLCAAVGALFITGCATAPWFPKSSSAAVAKGETASITGKLEKDKNHFVLTDVTSGISYQFVGMKKAEEARLSPYIGRTVTVKLEVTSTESAKVRIAKFIAIVK